MSDTTANKNNHSASTMLLTNILLSVLIILTVIGIFLGNNLLRKSSSTAGTTDGCLISTSPAPQGANVVDYEMISNRYSRAYKDDNGKFQFPQLNKTILTFSTDIKEYIQNDCKKNNYKAIYNLDIKTEMDDNNYFMYATYDIVK